MPVQRAPVIPPGPLSREDAAALNRALQGLYDWLTNFSAAAPLSILAHPAAGVLLRLDEDGGFWAKITGESTGTYSWVEQQLLTNGLFANLPSGRSGTTTSNYARELNGATGVPVNTVVRLWRGFLNAGAAAQEYLFLRGGGAPLQIQDEGVNLPQRTIINFVGEIVTALDAPAPLPSRTEVRCPDYGQLVDIQPVGLENDPGASSRVARADHIHEFALPENPGSGSGAQGFPPPRPANPYNPTFIFDFSTGFLLFWNPLLQIWQVVNCCEGSGFEFPPGPGPEPPPQTVGCCTGTVPGRLFATFSGSTCLNGVSVMMDYNSSTGRWEGVASVSCGSGASFIHIHFDCDTNFSPPVWLAVASCQSFASPFQVEAVNNFTWNTASSPMSNCQPVSINMGNAGSGGCGANCCNISFMTNVGLTVTE